MREIRRRRVLVFASLLLVLLVVPFVLSSSLVSVTNRLFYGNTSGAGTTSTTPKVFFDPVNVVDSRLQAHNFSKFTVRVNVSEVTDLFAWQITVTWNSSILSLNRIFQGEFLNRTDSANKTSSSPRKYGGLDFVMNVTRNVDGNVTMTETILEDVVPGDVPGVSNGGKNGTLVSIEFLVVDYGWTFINISRAGRLPTTLFNSTEGNNNIDFSTHYGWFDNRIPGDVNGDRYVTVGDAGDVSDRWSSPPGLYAYMRYVDLNRDGVISVSDAGEVSDNWLKSFPEP